jgi:hypothetical protein
MSVGVKVIFTIVICVLGIALFFVDSKANNAGPNWFWRLGSTDPVRALLFHPDGSFRRFIKAGALIFFGAGLLMLWLLVPTNEPL